MKKFVLAVALVMMLSTLSLAAGTVQIFSTDFGKIQIDAPYTLTLNSDQSNGNSLALTNGGSMRRSFSIKIWNNTFGEDLEGFAASSIGDHQYEKTTTDDSYTMLFYAYDQSCYTFIDHIKDKKAFVEIWGYPSTLDLSTDEFRSMCSSFAFVG